MRVVFLGVGAEQLSVELLSAILKQHGHQVELVYNASLFDDSFQFRMPRLARLFKFDDLLIEEAVALRPDVIAMSALTNTYRWGLNMAAAIKQRTAARVIFGGVHPSAVPETVINEPVIDAICIGEGDIAFPAWLQAVESGEIDAPIPNIWHKRPDGSLVKGTQRPFEQDLDRFPFPDKALYEREVRIQDQYLTMTGRGCPYRCTFCFNNFWAALPLRTGTHGGRYVRQRSVPNVIEELRQAKRRWNIRYVDIEDDVFTVDKRWIYEFSEAYRREIKLPLKCLTHPKYVDEDIVRWLKEAGCTWVQIGIQSLDEHYKHKEMKRYEKAGEVAWAIEAFTKAGISVKGDHIFGCPGEGVDTQEAARLFYSTYTPSRIQTFWMTYFPGLEMTDAALARGELSEADVRRLAHGEVGFFQSIDGNGDRDETRALMNFAFLFKMLPSLPHRLRRHVKPEWMGWLPAPLMKAIVTGTDITAALIQRNPEFPNFARYYLSQAWRTGRRRFASTRPLSFRTT